MVLDHKHIALFIPLALFSACNADDSALLSYQHTLQVGLYSVHTQNDTVLTDVKVYGIGREDSMLYDVESASSFYLNLNLSRCTTEFVIQTQTLQDNIFIRYDKELEPVSGSSGIAMEISVDSIGHTKTFIDSVSIVHKTIKYNESLENARFFVY